MSTSEMKLCPYCGEEIRAIAVKCRYCQTMLDGSAPGMGSSPGTGSSPGVGATGAGGGQSRLVAGTMVGAGRYELKRQLGAGGMGEVLLAEHTYTGQKVALKAVWPNLMAAEGPRKRFLQEGRVLASLKHPNIVGLTDFFEEEGRFYLAMEYIEGKTLAARLDAPGQGSAGLPITEVVSILKGILAGLAHAHKQANPVVHRDVKPANIMLANDGRVVLMDFGIAKVAAGEKLTSTAGVVGTYEYMSPEQVMGQEITPATDVYAVGIVAFELLTGRVPFPQQSDSGYDAMEGHRLKTPPPITQYRPDCPLPLVQWVEKALAKSPAQRFRDASEMLKELDSVGQARPAVPVVVTAAAALPARKSAHKTPATQSSSGSPSARKSGGGRSRTRAGPHTVVLVLLGVVAVAVILAVWSGGLGKKDERAVADWKKREDKKTEEKKDPPKPDPGKYEPKKDEPKKDEPKKDEPKKDEPMMIGHKTIEHTSDLSRPTGAWHDPVTGLTWQRLPKGGRMNWSAAKEHCQKLDLLGGGWRLPTVGELRSLVRGCSNTKPGGSCNVKDGGCLSWTCRHVSCEGSTSVHTSGSVGCYWDSDVTGACRQYWSSSPVADYESVAWYVGFDRGDVYYSSVDNSLDVRCVR